MSKDKNYAAVFNAFDKLGKKRAAELLTIQKAVDLAKVNLIKAQADTAEALQAGDLNKYQQAADDEERARRSVEFYEAQEKNREKAFAAEAKLFFDQARQDLYAQADAEYKDLRAELISTSDKLLASIDGAEARREEINELLTQILHIAGANYEEVQRHQLPALQSVTFGKSQIRDLYRAAEDIKNKL